MEFFTSILKYVETPLISFLAFILMISIVVFVHEFGHFYIARLCGVKVNDFSIGFGKKIFSRKDKHGTEWSVSALPMGGYVRFFGDKSPVSDDDMDMLNAMTEAEKKQSFYFKRIPQKMAIILAGPVANILLCLGLFFLINIVWGSVTVKPYIETLVEGRPAARNGLIAGDKFISVDGKDVHSASDVQKAVASSFGSPINFQVLRDKQIISLSFAPDMVSVDKGQEVPMIGVVFTQKSEHIVYHQSDVLESMTKAWQDTVFVADITFIFFKKLFLGQASVDNLSGPIRIGDAAGKAIQDGFWTFIQLMALISMSVGLVNLLPVPMLDGGHLVFYLLEAIGLKANHNIKEIAFKFGFIIVISVMIFTVVNDIITIGTK
jgi:regulator of sigma E protease